MRLVEYKMMAERVANVTRLLFRSDLSVVGSIVSVLSMNLGSTTVKMRVPNSHPIF